jgi:hypothetical protein
MFGSSHSHYMVLELAARLFPQFCPQNQRKRLTGVFNSHWGDVSSGAGSIPMHLKLFVLSASSVMLWLAPAALDKTVEIHKALQGVSLTAAIACAVTAGNIARLQAEQNEIEEIKTRAITADVVDEIATSAYISQQQRQQEAEQILNPREHLERSLALTYGEDEEAGTFGTAIQAAPEQNEDLERTERIHQLQARGYGKAKIILEIWGVTKGGSPKYKAAEAEYKRLIEGEERERER